MKDQGGVITLGKKILWERSFQKNNKTELCIYRMLDTKSRNRKEMKTTLIQNCTSFFNIFNSSSQSYLLWFITTTNVNLIALHF